MKAEDANAGRVPAPGSSHASRGSRDDDNEEETTKEEVAGIANEETELAPDSAGKNATEEEELASGSDGADSERGGREAGPWQRGRDCCQRGQCC